MYVFLTKYIVYFESDLLSHLFYYTFLLTLYALSYLEVNCSFTLADLVDRWFQFCSLCWLLHFLNFLTNSTEFYQLVLLKLVRKWKSIEPLLKVLQNIHNMLIANFATLLKLEALELKVEWYWLSSHFKMIICEWIELNWIELNERKCFSPIGCLNRLNFTLSNSVLQQIFSL